MSFSSADITRLTGSTVRDPSGNDLGRVDQVYIDADGAPTWATVRTGFLGSAESFLPLDHAVLEDRELRVPFTADVVADAPRVDPGEELSAEESDALHAHYERHAAGAADTAEAGASDTAGTDPSEHVELTRSEERLQVGTRRALRGRVRIRKHIVTAPESRVVAVVHEEARLVREPVDADAAGAPADGAMTEEEHEIVLHGDAVLTSKVTVPVERISVTTVPVTEEEHVTGTVRKERIESTELKGTTR